MQSPWYSFEQRTENTWWGGRENPGPSGFWIPDIQSLPSHFTELAVLGLLVAVIDLSILGLFNYAVSTASVM
jgi:hypothetical protein